jgi:hypothetical protein
MGVRVEDYLLMQHTIARLSGTKRVAEFCQNEGSMILATLVTP